MATVELTLEQLRDAILQLPTPQRRKLLAEAALSIATWMLPTCTLSIFSNATRWPPVSTTAMATFQLFARASRSAVAMHFLA